MGHLGPGTWSKTYSSLQCRLNSRNKLKEVNWRGAASGTKEFIGFYKVAK